MANGGPWDGRERLRAAEGRGNNGDKSLGRGLHRILFVYRTGSSKKREGRTIKFCGCMKHIHK